MQTDSRTITTTAACDLGRHSSCRKVVLTLTQDGTVECRCQCHGPVQNLPDAFKELAVLTPPCDQDAVLDDDELDDILAEDADRRNDDLAIGAWS